MAVFRVERTHNYTVMSNYHLRDKSISFPLIPFHGHHPCGRTTARNEGKETKQEQQDE